MKGNPKLTSGNSLSPLGVSQTLLTGFRLRLLVLDMYGSLNKDLTQKDGWKTQNGRLTKIGTFRSDYDNDYEYEFFIVYPVRMHDCVRL